MTRGFTRLAWTAAGFTYLLIILGAIVRITGSGMGCGEHWPLCNGKLLPPLDLPTLIEYTHRLVAASVSILVLALATYARWLREGAGRRGQDSSNGPLAVSSHRPTGRPSPPPYVALGLLAAPIALGAVTVKLELPPWTVILHLGTAMLLLATLIVAARGAPPPSPPPRGGEGGSPGPPRVVAPGLGVVPVLFCAPPANPGAAGAR